MVIQFFQSRWRYAMLLVAFAAFTPIAAMGETVPTCDSFTYSVWSACQNGTQTRSLMSAAPVGCSGGTPLLSQSCSPNDNGPISHWAFNEGAGSVVADSINGINGNVNDATWVGGALSFNGSSSYVEVPYDQRIQFGQNDSMAVAAWVAPSSDSLEQPYWDIVRTQNNVGSGTAGADLRYGYGLRVVQGIGAEYTVLGKYMNGLWIRSSGNINDGGWHHVVGVRDVAAKQFRLYVDGQLVKYRVDETTAQPDYGSIDSKKSVFFGVYAASYGIFNSHFKGLMSDIKIYRRSLTDSEILSDFQRGVPVAACTSWDYSDWGECVDGTQTRTVVASHPSNCSGGSPVVSRTCSVVCSEDTWTCGSWGQCREDNLQTRSCTKTYDCPIVETPAPASFKSCTHVPTCVADEWSCGDWGACTDNQQQRTCTKTLECPNVETASPATSRSCGKPSSDQLDESKQRGIYRATVKLYCPVSSNEGYWGSGTVVSSDGFILTNKHVIEGTAGCLVGFIQDYGDTPDFSGTVIADIYRTFGNQDVALLKIRDAAKNQYEYVNLAQGNGQPVKLGDRLLTFGYPGVFGETITYTSGDHSGMWGQFIKTSAILDHGSSGGGAYIGNGTFVGITTGGIFGTHNNLGYILPMDVVGPLIDPYVNVGSSAAPGQQKQQGDLLSSLKGKDLSTFSTVEPDIKRTRLIAKDVLIKGVGSSAVYYFANNGKRYVFSDERSFKSWFKGFDEVVEMSLQELADMPLGGVIRHRPGLRMIKIVSDPKVYAVSAGGELRWIKNEQVAERLYGRDWNRKIDDVDVALFANYRIGEPVEDAGQFDPTVESSGAASINADLSLPVLETTVTAET